MKKRTNIVVASMAVVLGLAGCKNKETGNVTIAEVATTEAVTVATTAAEVKTTEVVATEATTTEETVNMTAAPTSAEVTETEKEKGLLPISEENFPDSAFRAYIEEEADTNRDGFLSEKECAEVNSIDISNKGIADLTGIGNFTNLIYLDCSRNRLKEVDVGRNRELFTLMCYSNQLTNLDVSQNPKLTYLYCSDNQLTSLDLTSNTCLNELYCHQNLLTSLNVNSEGDHTGISVDPGVDISGNKNTYITTILTNDMVVKIDPVTGAATYPDGEYCCEVIDDNHDPENIIKRAESTAQGWCTAKKVENGYLYIEGYMSYYVDTADHEGQIWYIGDGHICLPVAENVKYYTPGDSAFGLSEVLYTQEDFNEGFGPIIFVRIEDGIVTEVTFSA